MSLPQSPRSFPAARSRPSRISDGGPVLAVGRRVHVQCPSGAGQVALTDALGTTVLAPIAEGLEVEILAWQPSWAGGTRYRVLCKSAGIEGWLGAASLKVTEPPRLPPAAVVRPAARAAETPKSAKPARRPPPARSGRR